MEDEARLRYLTVGTITLAEIAEQLLTQLRRRTRMSRVIVTAPFLVVMPKTILRLNDEEARERKLCTQPIGDGLYEVTLENHFKKGQIVEFQGEVPKHFSNSCAPVDDAGRVLPLERSGSNAFPAKPEASAAVGKGNHPAPPRIDLDGMTKAQLLDFAAQQNLVVDGSKNRAEILAALKKKTRAAA